MYSKTDFLDYFARHLAGASRWRQTQAARFPLDLRNEGASKALRTLATAATATEVSGETWERLRPLFNPKDDRWCELVARCSRDVGFRSNFDAYLQTIFEASAVTA